MFGQVEESALAVWVLQPTNPALTSEPDAPPASRRVERSLPRGSSVANRNRNPLNMKLGQGTRPYVEAGHATLSDVMPRDGGRFLRFRSSETGFRAAVRLLKGPHYDGLNLDAVVRRWTNHGADASILAGTRLNPRWTIRHLDRRGFGELLHAMAVAEGYRSSRIGAEIASALQE
ncbi:MAG: hypothetical protein ACT4QD_24440 [Acidobacteriota bacterium]